MINGQIPPAGPPIKIRLYEDEVEEMVVGYGFKKVKTSDIGYYNYLMTFQETDLHG